jgi:hypothetical protein
LNKKVLEDSIRLNLGYQDVACLHIYKSDSYSGEYTYQAAGYDEDTVVFEGYKKYSSTSAAFCRITFSIGYENGSLDVTEIQLAGDDLNSDEINNLIKTICDSYIGF